VSVTPTLDAMRERLKKFNFFYTACFKVYFVIILAYRTMLLSDFFECWLSNFFCISLFFRRATCFVHFGLFWVNYSIIIRQKSSIVMRFIMNLFPTLHYFFILITFFLTYPQHTFSPFVWKN